MEGRMLYRSRLYAVDGDEAGEAHYAILIKPGESIWTGDGRKAARARRPADRPAAGHTADGDPPFA